LNLIEIVLIIVLQFSLLINFLFFFAIWKSEINYEDESEKWSKSARSFKIVNLKDK